MKPLEKMKPIGRKVRTHVRSIFESLEIIDTPKQKESSTINSEIITIENTIEEKILKDIAPIKKPETNPIIGVYRKHFLFIFREWFSILLLTVLFAVLIFFMAKFLILNTYFSVFITIVFVLPILLRTFLTHFVYWKANAIVFRKKNLVFHKYKGVFTQSTEVRSIAQIKSFDIIQSGILQQFLNYGDIEVASMISGASKKIVLKDIYPVKEAYKTLSKHIESLDEKKDQKKHLSENGSDIPDDSSSDDDESEE